MAFNLFKRKETADIIFCGGTIYTMDAETPVVHHIACKDGIIIALGEEDDIRDYKGENTAIVDLKDKFVLPGFIDINVSTVNKIFQGSYVKLEETMTSEEIITKISEFKLAQPHHDYYLAYGYNESLFDESSQLQMRASLDKICDDKPIIAISSAGIHFLLNNFSIDVIRSRAEEMEIPVITPAFVIAVLLSTDYETLIKRALTEAYNSSSKGYTSIFNLDAFHYFDSTYRDLLIDLYQSDMLKQRYFSSLLLNRQIQERQVFQQLDQNHTACTELEEKINFNTLHIRYSGTDGHLNYMDEDYLSRICEKTADKGYHIWISALDKPGAIHALDTLGNLQASYKKLAFCVDHEEDFTEEELSHIFTGNVYIQEKGEAVQKQTTETTIEERTTKAAAHLGISDKCGSIEKGKWADFAIYAQDPTQTSLSLDFQKLQPVMTVLNANIVYTKEEDTLNHWIDKMNEHFQSINESFYL
ncbi:MAG: hypothetical protein EOM59_00530 [Clostridia bacterium]|nr:hypothetical protein [Clostridia bacterium]